MNTENDTLYATFEGFEIELTLDQAELGSHQGDCEEDVKFLLTLPSIKAQFETIKPENIRAELEGYGAWDESELADDEQNRVRILWIACGDIQEEEDEKNRRRTGRRSHEAH